jgi:hypothetical protein
MGNSYREEPLAFDRILFVETGVFEWAMLEKGIASQCWSGFSVLLFYPSWPASLAAA